MPTIYDQLEAEARSGPQLRAKQLNPLAALLRRGYSTLADATGASPSASQQIENSLLDVSEAIAGLWAPGGAKGAGLVLSPRNMPKLRAMMEANLGNLPKTPENIALAWSKAKYPKLTSIPDYSFQNTPKTAAAHDVLGEFLPASNTSIVYRQSDSRTPDYVNTLMHETQHARQAYRRRPAELTDPASGEILIDPLARKGAMAWSRDYKKYEDAAAEASRKYRQMLLQRGLPAEKISDDVYQFRLNKYRYENPYEVAAFRAGDTAKDTYRTFQKFDTIDRPGQRGRTIDRVRDWISQMFQAGTLPAAAVASSLSSEEDSSGAQAAFGSRGPRTLAAASRLLRSAARRKPRGEDLAFNRLIEKSNQSLVFDEVNKVVRDANEVFPTSSQYTVDDLDRIRWGTWTSPGAPEKAEKIRQKLLEWKHMQRVQ